MFLLDIKNPNNNVVKESMEAEMRSLNMEHVCNYLSDIRGYHNMV